MKTTTRRTTTLGLFAAAMGLATAPALAGDPADAAKAEMSPAEIVRAVEGAGYSNVRDIEFDDGRWEMEATSPAGAAVDIEVDARTGKVLHEEAD